jgi:hypothetical protein
MPCEKFIQTHIQILMYLCEKILFTIQSKLIVLDCDYT